MKKREIVSNLLGCALLSLLLEVSSYPKPFGVDRFKSLKNLRYENFLSTISFISFPIYNAILDGIFKNFKIGKRIYEATYLMIKNQSAGNTSFGSILLLFPLISSSAYYLANDKKVMLENLEELRDCVKYVLEHTTWKDSIYVCKSILLLKPRWLLKVNKYDITKENWQEEIKKDNANLKDIMKVAYEYDWIAYEYVKDFEITFKENLPYFIKTYNETKDVNETIIKTYVWNLSKRIDSHVYRTHGLNMALEILNKSKMIYENINKGYDIKKEIESLNKHFLEYNLNTGTTSDLISSCIFLATLLGIRI